MNLYRFFAFTYFSWTAFQLLASDYALVTIPLFAISALLSMFVLERAAYDLRSSSVLLLLICNLYFAGRTSFAFDGLGWTYVLGLFAYDLFLLGLVVAVTFARIVPIRTPSCSLPRRRLPFFLSAVVTLVLYLFVHRYLLHATGAEGGFMELVFMSLVTRLAVADQGLSPLLQLAMVLSTFGLASAFVLWRSFGSRLFLVIWIWAVGYAALTLGSRGMLVIPVLQLLLATSLLIPNPKRLLITVVLPIGLAVNAFSMWFLAAREGSESLDSGHSLLDRFDAYGNWMRAMAKHGPVYAPGASLRDAPLQFLPRQLYPEKPYYFSTEMTRIYHPEAFNRGINLDFGGIAESFYNFSLLGPLLFGVFVGWVVSGIERFRLDAARNRSVMSAFIYSQGALIPASFFFIGWINSSLIFVVLGYVISLSLLLALDSVSIRRGSR